MTRAKQYRKVSSDAFDRHDFDARLSMESAGDAQPLPPPYEKASRGVSEDEDDGLDTDEEDALDQLLDDEDVLTAGAAAGGKTHRKKQRRLGKTLRKRRSGARLSPQRRRRFLLFSGLFMLLGGVVAGACIGFMRMKQMQQVSLDEAAVQEVLQGMKEVPTLIGALPIDQGMPSLNLPPVEMPKVPEMTDESADDEEGVVNDPPALSAEAVDQAIAAQGNLADKTHAAVEAVEAALAQAAEDGKQTADEAGHKFKDFFDDTWAWMEAKWRDILGNTPGNAEVY